MYLLVPIIIGVLAGVSSGLFGIGGGVIVVPLVLYHYKFSQQSATATSLIALLLPVGSLGIWQFYKSGLINSENFKIGLLIALGMLVGTYFGAKLGVQIQAKVLSKMFAMFLMFIALKVWFYN